jgi:hypothetical protein
MRLASCAAMLTTIVLVGCGSDTESPTPGGGPGPGTSGFNPPAAPEGYTRLTAKTVKGIESAADVTYCQYIMAPFDRDMDVLDIGGYQSTFGHHAVAFSQPDDGSLELGSSLPCMGDELEGVGDASLGGGFLGGIGGEAGGSQNLPPGVAFRLKKGNGIMLNVHYLNTGNKPIDGDAVLDVKFAEVDPTRKIAAMFVNVNMGFELPPATRTDSSIECVADSDVEFLMLSNHMHEYGTAAKTEVVRANGGAIEMMKEDPRWAYEMQFNADYARWSVETPFILRKGDTVRTSCQWNNPTTEMVAFPREMCVAVGFVLATGDKPTSPACIGGAWIQEFGG